MALAAPSGTAGDYDGDGKADLAVWRPSTGQWFIVPSSNPGTPIVQSWGLDGDIPVPGDYDGDGKTDFAVWRPSTGQWYVIPSSNPGTPIVQSWGLPDDVPVPGDYDGDGKTDFAIWRPSTGQWDIIPSGNPGTPIVQSWGLPGDIPVPGDYDGDGKTDFAIWRPSTGQWYIILSSNPGAPVVQSWGSTGDIPAPGDYDGDGKTDFAVWRPSTGQWYIIPSSNPGTPIVHPWGLNGDIPVPRDYDGDGKTDLAVWRPSTQQWLIVPSATPNSPIVTSWGLANDLPAQEPVAQPSLSLSEIVVSQASNDIVWDSVRQVIYASVPSTAGLATGNTISVLNPFTGSVTFSQFAGSEPDAIAISGDAQYIYAGLDGSASVQRFVLPNLTPDISYSLGAQSSFGPYYALDLQVAPGAPHTTAVSLGNFNVSPAAQGGVAIFDDATMRATVAPGWSGGDALYSSLQWGSAATAIYAANNEDSGFDFYNLAVSGTGVALNKDYSSAFSSFSGRIHYDPGTQLVYGDDGHVIVPSTGLPAGKFQASGIMAPDSTLNTAFFLVQSGSQVTLTSYDLTRFTPVKSITIAGVSGRLLRLIRWGAYGLAFNTSGGQIFLIRYGNLVTSSPAP